MDQFLEYMTTDEAATIWNISPDQVVHACECSSVKGTANLSGQWIIPVCAPCPNYKGPSICSKKAIPKPKRTEKQQMFIDAFRGDSVPFVIYEHKIGKRIMTIVCTYSNTAKQTMSETVYGMYLDDLNDKDIFKTSVAEREKY